MNITDYRFDNIEKCFNERSDNFERQLQELKQEVSEIKQYNTIIDDEDEDEDDDMTVMIFESMKKLTQRVEVVETNLSSFTTKDELEQKISAVEKVQQQQNISLTTNAKT